MTARLTRWLRSAALLSLTCAVVALALSSLSLTSTAGENEFDPTTGYRIARFRTPVDPNVPGGKRIFIEDADALIKKGAILIDVLPSDGAGLDLTTGAWHMAKPHDNIPGSVWLPDVGRGQLDARLDAYYRDNLQRLTGGDTSRALLIYCQSDCWMGWNAVKRASSYGYTSIYWYADGVDGWRDWDRPFAKAEPVPVVMTGGSSNATSAQPAPPPQR